MPAKPVVLTGFSGHGLVVADAALLAKMNLRFYADIRESVLNVFGLEYLGNEASDFFDWSIDADFILGIGDNTVRERITKNVIGREKNLLNVIHPSAKVSKHTTIGIGNFISAGAIVNPLASIGNSCILNTGCIIEHECILSDYIHIAPGAVLAGNVSVGYRTFIGANSVIKQGVTIGNDVVIGAGSVILKNIPDGQTYAGNPGKPITKSL